MKKIKGDPLLSIFKNTSNEEYIEEIESIQNIPIFFTFLSLDISDEIKIDVFENLLIIFKKNRYITEYFSSYNNKSIYLYLFELYISKNSSIKLKSAILKLIEELIVSVETNKEVYEYLFQNISKIYNKENTNQEKTPENLNNYLTLLNTLLFYKEKIPKPLNYFVSSGKGKFSLDLNNKKLKIGYCMSFILNFKIGESNKNDEISSLFNITFSNKSSINFKLKSPGIILLKMGTEKESMLKVLPTNEFVVLVINLVIEDNHLEIYNYVNGENKLSPVKYKNNIDLKKDTIESLEFFDNFYGEVTSIIMLLQEEKAKDIINSKKFLPSYKQFFKGIHKKKELKKYLEVIYNHFSCQGQSLKDIISSENKLIEFIFTPFNYFHFSWDKIKTKEKNKIIDDYFGKYKLIIKDENNSIRHHRYHNYQKKIYLVCDITNFLPIAEMFLIHPQLLTEQNLELYLKIIENIINFRKSNVDAAKQMSFFKILCLFFEKYPNQIFTEKIIDVLINIGKDMFKNNLDQVLTKKYFKNILLNEKILSKYSENLQIKFWNQLLLFCESDSDQLETFIKMNRICLILRFYDKNKYNEMCCKNHLDMFKNEFAQNCDIMEPSMDKKLKDIWKIIDLIINSQKPIWVLSLFKLLMMDLSPCLTKFIIIAIIKALIRHNENEKNDYKKADNLDMLKNMVYISNENNWLKDFIKEMISSNYETIIINSFIHSLPDVKFDMLKLIYQIYQSLMKLDPKTQFKKFVNMMRRYLLPQKMFYETINNKEVLVINDKTIKEYLNNIIILFIYWALDIPLIEKNEDISFSQKIEIDKQTIKNSDILEIIFELIKQINYDVELITKFFELLINISKNKKNCDILLYNYKIFLMLINLDYECYLLKLNDKSNNKDIEKCFKLGKKLISNIYINDLIYKENQFIDENYTFNEISLIFLWGDNILFNNNNKQKKTEIKEHVFSYISELFKEILSDYKSKIFPKIKINTFNNVKQNFIKSYYHQNYLIFTYKFFEFSFEYTLDQAIKDNHLKSIFPNKDVFTYNSAFLTSMRIYKPKEKSISLYWEDYPFFEELYSKISYMWQKEYIFKDYEKGKQKNSNKIDKYEDILKNLILNEKKRNIFKKELEFLCLFYAKENEYDIYGESKDKDSFVEIISNNSVLNISLIKQIQISLLSMLTIIISKENETELLKWLKELKHFTIFLIIASSNVIIKQKEDKEPLEKQFVSYNNLQEQCLYALYNCLYFLYQIRSLCSICKAKIDKTCINVLTLCFVILRNTLTYRKKNKIIKKFNVGYKINNADLSGCAIFNLFNEYVKDKDKEKSKEKEKGDNIFITLDKLNTLLDKNNYFQNIITLLNNPDWNDNFNKFSTIKDILDEKYFPINKYKIVVEQRVNTIKKIEEYLNSEDYKYEYSSNELLKLLPLYEKELVHYSNNSLEKNIKKKNLYKVIKKNIFSWRGYWSDRDIFYQDSNTKNDKNKDISNNDLIADRNNVSKLKYKLINHYTKSFMKPILVPILDIHYYLPDFSGFNPDKIFNIKDKFIVDMDLDKIKKIKDEQKNEKTDLKENYLRKIYIKSSKELADKLLKISESLDFGKEEEFSVEKEDNNEEENEKNYYLCCLVKTSHHIKGVCFIDDISLNFKVFLNQRTGNAMTGVKIGFTDKDDDYDQDRKTCFGSYFMFHQKDKNLYKITINYSDIKLILLKRYYYKNSALEIFTITNKSYYLNFKFEEEREKFINNLIPKFKEPKAIINDFKESKDNLNIIGYSIQPQLFKDKRKYTRKDIEKTEKSEKKKTVRKLSKTIKEWSRWKINNFAFLMWMNFYANRSYNDISQYPIFPWILSNFDDPLNIEPTYYESSLMDNNTPNQNNNVSVSEYDNSINTTDTTIDTKKKKKNHDEYCYRDLKLPMGMLEINELSKKRKNDYIEIYNTMKNDKNEFEGTKPYYYGSNYSNPIYVCNFLMRIFPFTHISIELQGNALDDPNRLFLSVVKSFNNSISQKTDVRELIPEFFYLPEMFLNINDINLGKEEDNSIVYNVTTPCNNNAYCFVEMMKRIFENNRISSHLNYWVDLIFGYKVKGKEAENAKNIFTEASYQENINLKNVENKESYLRMVEFGLIPNQLMNKECLKREKKSIIRREKELTEYNWTNANKIKVIPIKHDTSNDKNTKNTDGTKKKLLKADIINRDRIIMIYNNDFIVENKINNNNEDIVNTYKIKPFENKIHEDFTEKINNKTIKFCNFGKIVIVGGFYDGLIQIIYLEDKIEKKRKDIYPFTEEEEPILSIGINNDETFMILGNAIGSIAIFKIDLENDKWQLFKKRYHQMSPISDININNDLNIFATSSIDGYINLYTLPLCKLVRSIKIPLHLEKNGKCNYIFLAESSLPSIVIITEDDDKCELFSYSINGKFLAKSKEDKSLECPIKIKDLNSFEYLVYYAKLYNHINIINLPSLSIQIVIEINFIVKSLCVNDDLSTIYLINDEGNQIHAIKS